jgi:hypothetical protein
MKKLFAVTTLTLVLFTITLGDCPTPGQTNDPPCSTANPAADDGVEMASATADASVASDNEIVEFSREMLISLAFMSIW